MVNIQLQNISKRFNKEWIFKKVNLEISSSHNHVILGRNGSGKSTFLQTLIGKYEPSEGKITYSQNGKEIKVEDWHKIVSISAPYLELFEEYTLTETIKFQHQFKPFIKSINLETLPELLKLEHSKNKRLKYYSSGMKQRVKLGLAILSDTPVLFLDEPSGNLDQAGINWYQELITQFANDKLIIVSSNNLEHEYFMCDKLIEIEQYKL